MNVVAYIRVSTDGQTGDDKFGLDAQREQILNYCQKNDMTVVKWQADEGESGAKERPGFDELVYAEDFGNPPYEAVVVAKSDRVARDINIYYYYKMLLTKKNIKLVSISEDFGQFGVFASMLEAFTLCCAEMERDNIMKRTTAGKSIKASRGGYSGGRPPMGYKSENRKLVIVPEEAEIVRYVFEHRTAGETMQAIRDGLNSNPEFKSRGGNAFQISIVQKILMNEKIYRGLYKYGPDSEWVQGEHEPILK